MIDYRNMPDPNQNIMLFRNGCDESQIDAAIEEIKQVYTLPLYAVTITLHPSEVQALTKLKKNLTDYLVFKMYKYGYTGIAVEEYTKKKVPHLHFVGKFNFKDYASKYLVEVLSPKGKKLLHYSDKRIGTSNVVKLLNTQQAVTGWCKYIKKESVPSNIIDMLNKYVIKDIPLQPEFD